MSNRGKPPTRRTGPDEWSRETAKPLDGSRVPPRRSIKNGSPHSTVPACPLWWRDMQDKVTAQSLNPARSLPLWRITWVDAHNNQGAWVHADDITEFGQDEAYKVTQVGYLVYEDDLCVVLAARISEPSPDYGQSFGMLERIPKKLIDDKEVL